jgi:hypothetical protein
MKRSGIYDGHTLDGFLHHINALRINMVQMWLFILFYSCALDKYYFMKLLIQCATSGGMSVDTTKNPSSRACFACLGEAVIE